MNNKHHVETKEIDRFNAIKMFNSKRHYYVPQSKSSRGATCARKASNHSGTWVVVWSKLEECYYGYSTLKPASN